MAADQTDPMVCARGESNWVRNVRSAGEVVLARAMRRHRYAARELPPSMRPPVLKAYLDRFASEVQRFFPVPKGSAMEARSSGPLPGLRAAATGRDRTRQRGGFAMRTSPSATDER
jgi:hypothetical protein